MKAALRLSATALGLLLTGATAVAVPMLATYTDGAGEGFNDPTVGPARRAVFETALGHWAARLEGSLPVPVSASFDPMGGSASNAVLGAAGAGFVVQNFEHAPLASTWYPAALGCNIAGTNYNPGFAMVSARFNSDVDGDTVLGARKWYYGLDGNAGSDVDFYQVALHELGHGLGFQTFIGRDGTYLVMGGQYQPGVYDRFLAAGPELSDPRLVTMDSVERAAAVVSNELYFTGARAMLANGGPGAAMYAPGSFTQGSSISHLSQSAYQYTPNALMCPRYVSVIHSIGPVSEGILRDMGWSLTPRFTMLDLRTALLAASGLEAIDEGDRRLDVVSDGDSAGVVDLRDAAVIARSLSGLAP